MMMRVILLLAALVTSTPASDWVQVIGAVANAALDSKSSRRPVLPLSRPGLETRRPKVPERLTVPPEVVRSAQLRLDRLRPGLSEPEMLRVLRLHGRDLVVRDHVGDGGRERRYLLDETRWIVARYHRDGRLIEAGIEGYGWNRSDF